MKTLKKLIEKGKFNYVNSLITDKNFPDDGKRGNVEIFPFDKKLETDEVIKLLDEKGYRPATIYELLNWKDWNGLNWVIALGSVWQFPGGYRFCPCLDRFGSGRWLRLFWVGNRWNDHCRFAAVRKKLRNLDTKNLEPSDTLPSELLINGTKYIKSNN